MNAIFDAETDVGVVDKRQLGFDGRQLIVALLQQPTDALNRVVSAPTPTMQSSSVSRPDPPRPMKGNIGKILDGAAGMGSSGVSR